MTEKAKGEVNGIEWRHLTRDVPDSELYPRTDRYQFGCWPVIVIETGGYCDLEAIDPATGEKLWSRVWEGEDTNVYTALRRLVDAMEAARFLDSPEDPGPDPATGSTPAGSPPDGLG